MRSCFPFVVLVFAVLLSPAAFAQKAAPALAGGTITLIEIGSDRCIPCLEMQKVLRAVREKYSRQVDVVFQDVRTPEGKAFAARYQVEVIPVQLFLDKDGREFFCHEGFFPEEELIAVLRAKGVTDEKPKTKLIN